MQKPVINVILSKQIIQNLRAFPVLYYLKKQLLAELFMLQEKENSVASELARFNDLLVSEECHTKRHFKQLKKTLTLNLSHSARVPFWLLKSCYGRVYQLRDLTGLIIPGINTVSTKLKGRESLVNGLLQFVGKSLEKEKFPTPNFQGMPALKVPKSWASPVDSPQAIIAMSSRRDKFDWNLDEYIEFAKGVYLNHQKSVDFLVDGEDSRMRLQALQRGGVLDWGVRIIEPFADIRQKIAYINGAKFLVSTDSDSLHIAHALGKDIFAVYPSARNDSFWKIRPHGYWHSGVFRYQIRR